MSSVGPRPAPAYRVLRRLLTPVSHRLALSGRPQPLACRNRRCDAAGSLRQFMIVVPGAERLALSNATGLADRCRLTIVLNGFSLERSGRLAATLPAESVIRLSTVPGFPVKHGTALTVLIGRSDEEFAIVDPDCLIVDSRLLELPPFGPAEFLAAPHHPHFFNVNPATGEHFPRTHFLVLNARLVRSVMRRHRITAEKYTRVPARLVTALGERGYGRHNYPRAYLGHFDTLLLIMAMALHDGLRIRWLAADEGQLRHPWSG